MAEVFLSVVIPVYNEEKRLAPSLEEVLTFLKGFGRPSEVVVVDDGSADKTAALVLARAKTEPMLRLVRLPANRGKGAAVRAGMLEARGKIRLFRDADSSTGMEHVAPFLAQFERGADVVIGSRRVAGAKFVRRQPLPRELLGRGFTFLCRALLVWEVRDFTCGFKAFTDRAATEVFSRQLVDRWSFDAEIMFLAGALGFKIAQVPVTWKDDEGTKVRLARDVAGSFAEIGAILANRLRGAYRLR